MQELDIAQKVLEDHKDVFADIVNGLLFQGREVVKVTDRSYIMQMRFWICCM